MITKFRIVATFETVHLHFFLINYVLYMRHDLCSDKILHASSNSPLPVAITQIADDSIRKAAGLLFAVCKFFT